MSLEDTVSFNESKRQTKQIREMLKLDALGSKKLTKNLEGADDTAKELVEEPVEGGDEGS